MSTLPELVDAAAERWPEATAAEFGDRRATFAGFAERTRRIAGGLRARGVGPGEHVAILMENGVETLAAIHGATRGGMIAVPVNARYKARELAYVLEHAEARVVLSSPGFAALLEEAAGGCHVALHDGASWRGLPEGEPPDRASAPEDVAMLLYTSGTTSHPKGCMLTHRALVHTGREFGLHRFPTRDGDRMWDPLPLFHLATLLPFNGCLVTGCAFVGGERFEPGAALRALATCTVAFAAFDLIWVAVLDHPDFASTDLSNLRLLNVNGVPERQRLMAARTPWLTQITPYGATEGGGVLALSHLDDPLELRLTTAGRPFAGFEARIVDPFTREELPRGERGEIAYRGPGMFEGYYKDPEQTAIAVSHDGFFHSGDLGSMDADGRLSYHGRIKDMLKVGGENVAAAEIEGFLAEHPAISEVQVVAAPDRRYDEVPCAFVALRPGAELTIDELIAYCRGRIATFKIPRYLRIVEDWPMSGTKIQKFKLRAQIADELQAAGVSEAPKL
jgi:fatty-acyl-CoA synthase